MVGCLASWLARPETLVREQLQPVDLMEAIYGGEINRGFDFKDIPVILPGGVETRPLLRR
jgi:hypothetical protein